MILKDFLWETLIFIWTISLIIGILFMRSVWNDGNDSAINTGIIIIWFWILFIAYWIDLRIIR